MMPGDGMLYGVPRQPSKAGDEHEELLGIACPSCGCRDLRVWRTRPLSDGRIRRERKCRNCGRLVLTTERVIG